MNEHLNYLKWLKQTEVKPQRPKEAHLLAVIDKGTGKICNIEVSQESLHTTTERGSSRHSTHTADTTSSAWKPTSEE